MYVQGINYGLDVIYKRRSGVYKLYLVNLKRRILCLQKVLFFIIYYILIINIYCMYTNDDCYAMTHNV